ncbi:glutamine--fructose-6-phosphate transaminase (isomerizing) [Haloferax larsenii]|uniref:Glutamine--fructose-6-phosphate aminotransferase [isomerizing] n=1 Tax=Haloferax larsenii TaxID=302484 RepID=A0ABY5RCM3_HALLR|nr:glutamine--fructose-6-phosphate transaminase (isomerizing) [Haloferax larsenii]ELZ81359.1 glutamine--fructose-6-phosphate aminotransferase (isomerizing) [Haloferax larsenii JCM 13917]UVE49780.1 glutamine--fructose-6-phosphate transaminase (isomerizing) [Haloferax larsenii]
MCGIIACIGHTDDTVDVLLSGLSSLEYRGYDSAGIAVSNGKLDVRKREGELDNLRDAVDADPISGTFGIGHTRWSTHGPPTDENAHPHTDADGRVAVVHNGIIENYQELRDELEADGYEFVSDTDTEVVPNLVASFLDEGYDAAESFSRAVSRLEGSYALAVIVAGEDAIFATRQDSPLVLGIGDDAYYLGSDVPAFLSYTRNVVYLEDGQSVTLRPNGWQVKNGDGAVVEPPVNTVEWDAEQTGKSGYEHFMLKEIHEQPTALRQCLSGRLDPLEGDVVVEELSDLDTPGAVQFVACGTSYHAALYGAMRFREVGIPAQAFLASEYATAPPPIADDELVVGVTQSGETADTLSALRTAQGRGAETLAVTNVVGSTASRECDHVMYIRSGPEIGVAATKTFSSQLVSLSLFVESVTSNTGSGRTRALVESLRDVAGDVQSVLDDSEGEIEDLVDELGGSDAYFFIGRGYNAPVALEGALKFKEITYEHAEGFPAGELKHGPLALITDETPVFAVVTGDDEAARKTLGNIKEVQARGAPVVAVTDGVLEVERFADEVLRVPETDGNLGSLLANVQLQLVAYEMAASLGRPIDKPRNLAKSVTVE